MLNLYSTRQKWKLFLLVFGVLIGILSLLYTNSLVNDLEKEERKNVQLWAEGMKRLGQMESGTGDISIILEVIKKNETVPMIVVDEDDQILFVKNLDTLRQNNEKYLRKQLEEMKLQNPPIINYLTEDIKQYVYYKDSVLLKRLLYYPYIQLAIILVFLWIAYYAFNSTRKAEQNQVWLGMAKETAHQLGTPISSLLAWVELLSEDKQVQQNILTEIRKDVSRLEIIADRFSKIGSDPKLSEILLAEQILKTIAYMKLRVSSKVMFDDNLTQFKDFTCYINPPLFDWVIENLFKNAIDAMDGKGKITVEVTDANQFLYIDISDTGKGIAKSHYKTIFNPGYTTKKRGWGLGLSLTKRIIEEYHKGRIFVKRSEVNKGTTFRIALKKQHTA
ncbi:MAG: HAMP domain-containing histidine kinase [Bacteroidales bacterium]|nr:HAMP domain-containing histidine kinase [Bacteroidales bacterium]